MTRFERERARPVRTYAHRPTHAEVDAFLTENGWTFVDGDARILAGNVLDDVWTAAIGERPWRAFAPGVEQTN